jgi:hypothetical protein
MRVDLLILTLAIAFLSLAIVFIDFEPAHSTPWRYTPVIGEGK